MGYKQESLAPLFEFLDFVKALLLEPLISHTQHFVNDQDFRIHMRGHSEPKAHDHPTRVRSDRIVQKSIDLGEFDDAWQQLFGSLPAQPHERSVQMDVFQSRQVRVKAGTQLKESRHATCYG